MTSTKHQHQAIPSPLQYEPNSHVQLDSFLADLFQKHLDKYSSNFEANEPSSISQEDLDFLIKSLPQLNAKLKQKHGISGKFDNFDFIKSADYQVLDDELSCFHFRKTLNQEQLHELFVLLRILDNNIDNEFVNLLQIQHQQENVEASHKFKVYTEHSMGTLEDYVNSRVEKNEKMNIDEILNVARKVYNQILGLSQIGIVHRNVCAKNILVTPNGDFKLINFQNAAVNTEKKGQVRYSNSFKVKLSAPEFEKSKTSLDFDKAVQADVYELGLVIKDITKQNETDSVNIKTAIDSLMGKDRALDEEIRTDDSWANIIKDKFEKSKENFGKHVRDSFMSKALDGLSRLVILDRLAELFSPKELKQKVEYEIQQILDSPDKDNESNQKSLAFGYGLLATSFLVNEKYDQAIKYHKKAIEIYEKLYESSQHDDVATSYNNMATAYYYQKKYPEAIEYYHKALELHKKLHGEKHPSVAHALKTLAIAMSAQEKYDESITLRYQAIDIFKKVHGTEKHEDIIDSYRGLGAIAHAQKDLKKALEHQLKMIELQQELYGKESPEVADTYCHIAATHNYDKNIAQAIKNYEMAFEIRKKVFGEVSKQSYELLFAMGNVYFHEKKFKESLEYYVKGLEIQKKLFKEASAELIHTYSTISMIHTQNKKFDEALVQQKRALEIQEKVFGPKSTEVANSYMRMTNIYYSDNKFDQALENVEKALEILKKDHLGNIFQVIECLKTMAIIHSKKKEFRKSLELLKHCKNLTFQIYQNKDHEKVKELTDAIKNVAYQVSMQEVTFWKFLKSFNWPLALGFIVVVFAIHQLFISNEPYINAKTFEGLFD